MSKEFELSDVIEIISEKLENGGTVTFTPNGTSMLPMLRDGEDVVVLKKPTGRLHLFDVPLYRRPSDGHFVLHRVVDFMRDGSYILCGDNQFHKERGIYDKDIIGVMTSFTRKGKSYTPETLRYRIYINFWYYTRPFRHIYRFSSTKAKRFLGIEDKPKKDKTEPEAPDNKEIPDNNQK